MFGCMLSSVSRICTNINQRRQQSALKYRTSNPVQFWNPRKLAEYIPIWTLVSPMLSPQKCAKGTELNWTIHCIHTFSQNLLALSSGNELNKWKMYNIIQMTVEKRHNLWNDLTWPIHSCKCGRQICQNSAWQRENVIANHLAEKCKNVEGTYMIVCFWASRIQMSVVCFNQLISKDALRSALFVTSRLLCLGWLTNCMGVCFRWSIYQQRWYIQLGFSFFLMISRTYFSYATVLSSGLYWVHWSMWKGFRLCEFRVTHIGRSRATFSASYCQFWSELVEVILFRHSCR